MRELSPKFLRRIIFSMKKQQHDTIVRKYYNLSEAGTRKNNVKLIFFY